MGQEVIIAILFVLVGVIFIVWRIEMSGIEDRIDTVEFEINAIDLELKCLKDLVKAEDELVTAIKEQAYGDLGWAKMLEEYCRLNCNAIKMLDKIIRRMEKFREKSENVLPKLTGAAKLMLSHKKYDI